MCDSVTTGASNDIEMATRIARAMVTQFGMSEEFGLMGVESVENRYLDGRAVTNCGDDTIAKVDEVVKVMTEVQTAELSENETELSGNEPVAPEEAFEE